LTSLFGRRLVALKLEKVSLAGLITGEAGNFFA
jgi:hypothetical protein